MANVLAADIHHVVAVLRPDAELTRTVEATGCEVVINHDAVLGMGTSIAAGVAATPDAAGWIIALGDMPSIGVPTIAAVKETLQRGASIVVPTMNGRRGHPVGFSARYFEALTHLKGDVGARVLLQAEEAVVEEISVNDRGIFADIDTPEDLER